MSENDVVEALSALGFTVNEGRCYAALLAGGPATGYEVGQKAGVPRSAVYGALRRLVSQGAARSVSGSPERFVPVPPTELQRLLRKRFEAQETALERAIESLSVDATAPDAFTVEGYERVLEEAERLVRSAEERLVVSGWPRELALLEDELAAAAARDVYLVLFSHAELSPSLPGLQFSYGRREADLEAFWQHRLVLVADDRRTLIGATQKDAGDNAVISETAAIAEITTSQVALDITLLGLRTGHDVEKVMAKMLGDRVGRLDTLAEREATPVVGRTDRGGKKAAKRKTKKKETVR